MDKKDNKRQYVIRNLRHDEIGLLKDFLYEAIYVPEGVMPPARDIIEMPELKLYIEEFGTRRGDNCLVADFGGKAAGAVWARIMDDYGHVDDETPSIAISLYREYRGQGIGSRMMQEMLEQLKARLDEAMSFATCAREWEQIGDCIAPSNVRNAVRTGYDAANRI